MQSNISMRQRALMLLSKTGDVLNWAVEALGGITVWECEVCEAQCETYGPSDGPAGWLTYGDSDVEGRVWCSDECLAKDETGGNA